MPAARKGHGRVEGDYLEVRSPSSVVPSIVALDGDEITVGRLGANAVVLAGDDAVSRFHAAIRSVGPSWCIRDLGSSNGTYVNGNRLNSEIVLNSQDEIRVGQTVIRFVAASSVSGTVTTQVGKIPRLTDREKDVLRALCRPVLSASAFTEPASVRDMARELFITDNAVKQHLLHLYDKFGIVDPTRRRTRLANEVVRLGIVTRADLQ